MYEFVQFLFSTFDGFQLWGVDFMVPLWDFILYYYYI